MAWGIAKWAEFMGKVMTGRREIGGGRKERMPPLSR
jgi:hypothetical protein